MSVVVLGARYTGRSRVRRPQAQPERLPVLNHDAVLACVRATSAEFGNLIAPPRKFFACRGRKHAFASDLIRTSWNSRAACRRSLARGSASRYLPCTLDRRTGVARPGSLALPLARRAPAHRCALCACERGGGARPLECLFVASGGRGDGSVGLVWQALSRSCSRLVEKPHPGHRRCGAFAPARHEPPCRPHGAAQSRRGRAA